jgi:hypothetical protein
MIQERNDLVDKLDEFDKMTGATPAEIRNLASEVSYCLCHDSIPTVESSLWRCFVITVIRTVMMPFHCVSIMGRDGYFPRV